MFHISVLLALVLLGIFLRAFKSARARAVQLRMIPTVGPSGVFSSYIGATRYIFDAQSILQEGYDKYHLDPGLFKVPLLDRWQVLVCSPSTIADIKTAPESRVSARDAVFEILEGQYTLGPSIFADPYHSSIVQGPLTRSLAKRFPEMYEEAALAFAEEFRNRNADADEWCQIPVWSMVLNVVSRTTTNFMLGSSLCRNHDWLALNIKFAKDVALTIGIINLFPNVLKPFAGNFLTPVPYTVARAVKHLEPLYAERTLQSQAKKINDDDGDDDNNDLISWIITEIQSDHHPQLRLGSQQQKIRELTTRVLAIQFFSIYTTSVIFTHALFYLAQNQNLSLIDSLREEIDTCVQKHGWTKAATEEMFNLESVMGEVMRLAPLNGVLADRIPRDDFTFSNGISVPRGTLLGIPIYCLNRDEMYHANAEQFDGFRFANPQQDGGRYKMTTSSAKNLGFGLGRAACPGRFFVANELKMFLAHVLITYDFRYKNQKDNIPEFRWFSQRIVPDNTAMLLFRKRKTSG